MNNGAVRVVIGILIGCAILVGAYFILPGNLKNPITAFLEKTFEGDKYTTVIDPIKECTVPKHKKVTLDAAMQAATKNAVWTYKKTAVDKAGNGSYEVYCDGYKCTVSLENDQTADSMITHTNAHVRLTFYVEKNGTELKVGGKTVESGKKLYPDTVTIDQIGYSKNDQTNTYYQQTLDFLASQVAE